MLLLTSVARLFYVPVLIGGVACGLLRRGGDAWLRTGLLIVIAVQVLTLLAGGVGMAVTSAQIAGNFGPIGAAGLVGQSFFGTVGQAVPLALRYWLMSRTGARRVLAAYGG
jgi:hypothetical protein